MTKKKNATFLFVALTVLAVFIAGGYFALPFLRDANQPGADLSHVRSKPEIVLFASRTWPDAYKRFVELDLEINFLDQEIERLNTMEKEFPQQKKIIQDEKTIWERISKNLHSVLDNFEKGVETVYVTYSVNKEKGLQSIQDSQEAILKPIDEALAESGKLTARLRAEPEQNFIDRIKKLISR